jgi:hypothetical protein
MEAPGTWHENIVAPGMATGMAFGPITMCGETVEVERVASSPLKRGAPVTSNAATAIMTNRIFKEVSFRGLSALNLRTRHLSILDSTKIAPHRVEY